MKKLLVLALVLSVASLANAALNLSIQDNGDGTFAVVQTGTFTASADNSDFMVVGLGGTSGGTLTALAPSASYLVDDAVGNGVVAVPEGMNGILGNFGALILPPATQDFAGGIWISGAVGVIGDTIQIYTLDGAWEVATAMGDAVTLTPEPMTMGLLGLGALFLRRRK